MNAKPFMITTSQVDPYEMKNNGDKTIDKMFRQYRGIEMALQTGIEAREKIPGTETQINTNFRHLYKLEIMLTSAQNH